jgi:hypothetical protein
LTSIGYGFTALNAQAPLSLRQPDYRLYRSARGGVSGGAIGSAKS